MSRASVAQPVAWQQAASRTASRRGPREAPLLWVGLAIVLAYGAIALLAPLLAPYDPAAYSGSPLERPSAAHWLGTNDVGQDIFSELLYGARASLAVAVLSTVISLAVAALCGVLAGYLGGWLDFLLLRLTDVVLALPHLPLMILLAAYLPPSLGNLILVIAVLAWPVPARAVRAQTLALRTRGYVAAARLFGARPLYVAVRHLLPALAPLLMATFVALAARAAMLEAGLALLGLGDPLLKSWGSIMRAAISYNGIFFTPHWTWWLLPPALAVGVLVMAFSLVGIGLEARLDPQLRRHV